MENEETTSFLYKNTIQYLHDLAEHVPDSLTVLKSYYASKFRISELQTKISVEKSKNKQHDRCPRCCLKLRETESSYFVKPETKKSKFARKVLRKVKVNKGLTKFQARYLKKNDLQGGNRLVVTCNFCKKEVIYKCNKPEKKRIHFNDKKQSDNQNKFVKKVKKKNDKFCGLRKDVVTAVQLHKSEQISAKKQIIGPDNTKRVLNSGVNKKKEKIDTRKNMQKLRNMLTKNLQVGSKNNLSNFLQTIFK